jgi:integrase
VKRHVAALGFFFVKRLRRPYGLDDIPYPKVPRRLPTILTIDEVTWLIDAARTLTDRTMLMVLCSTGMRNAEMRRLQVKDIDHQCARRDSNAAPLAPKAAEGLLGLVPASKFNQGLDLRRVTTSCRLKKPLLRRAAAATAWSHLDDVVPVRGARRSGHRPGRSGIQRCRALVREVCDVAAVCRTDREPLVGERAVACVRRRSRG